MSSGRWRYPANFDDADPPKHKKEKKAKKDRWARTEDAYSASEEQSRRRKSKKKKKKDNRSSIAGDSINSRDSTTEFPEAAEGGLYGDGSRVPEDPHAKRETGDDIFSHQL